MAAVRPGLIRFVPWVLVLASLFPVAAAACKCAFAPLDTAQVRAAKTVFVFRLVGADLQPKGATEFWASTVVGRIQVLDTLRGRTTASRIRYSTFWCCGTRLEVGRSYAAFVSEEGPELAINSGNVLLADSTSAPYSASMRARLVDVLKNGKEFDRVFASGWQAQTSQDPPPPPPPPHCPPARSRHR